MQRHDLDVKLIDEDPERKEWHYQIGGVNSQDIWEITVRVITQATQKGRQTGYTWFITQPVAYYTRQGALQPTRELALNDVRNFVYEQEGRRSEQ